MQSVVMNHLYNVSRSGLDSGTVEYKASIHRIDMSVLSDVFSEGGVAETRMKQR